MSVSSGFNAVLYAKDLGVMTAFYRRVLDVTAVEERPSIVELRLGGSRLMLHAIPAHIAATFTIDVPPLRREEATIKLSFEVASLLRARAVAAEVGGALDAVEREWEAEGRRYADGVDPEGNVLQFHEAIPSS